ncbi:type II toxin-antitoxin system RelE family toxin [Solidesulfovibrio sp.]
MRRQCVNKAANDTSFSAATDHPARGGVRDWAAASREFLGPEASDTSALKNSPYRRTDVGEYRIIYRVEGDVLLVPLIGKRNDGDVYKRFEG